MTTRPIRRLLIANRGEIACRIARTCRGMGITSVAVFSDADAGAPHVHACDEAVRIGPAESRASYLAIDRLVAAARATGCDAVHPGYGFLSENADFAAACAAAGLVFVGPAPEVIRALGSKENARGLAERAGVPVVPSFPASEAAADRLTYPVLLKASAGGGGKGMRVVRAAAELPAALAAARREAASAFGDDTLLVERYVEGARHIEIQIFGDQHGNVVHLFERECSIQRRHQKIIEESPSPAVTPELRAEMGRAALLLAREVGYVNAGTVEFILAPEGAFYFLEVNTRLQVEHPVTELVTGLDLVREQLRVAEGHPLSFGQADLVQRGHAVECRLYAEDPQRGFLPASGTLAAWRPPEDAGLRVDAGVRAGGEVTIHYDPMLAKIVAHAPDRAEALRRMAHGLEQLVALGIATNRGLLIDVLRHPEFAAGRFDTHFLDRHRADLLEAAPGDELVARAAVAAALCGAEERSAARSILPDLAPGWRNNRGADPAVRLRLGERSIEVRYRLERDGRYACAVDGAPRAARIAVDGADVRLEDEAGVVRRLHVVRDGSTWHIHAGTRDLVLVEEPRFPDRAGARAEGGLTAPMPGRVVKVLVEEGQACAAGQQLVLLEAMKMEHAVTAGRAGRIARVHVRAGDPVLAGAPLVDLEPEEQA